MKRRFLPLLMLLALAGANDSPAPKPLIHAHAHNDYEHTHPLLDALDQGFCSIEADVYLIQGHLLVAHDPRELSPQRTLQSLYLDPLKQRISENGGRVYKNGPSVTLMIDVKSNAAVSYTALKDALKPYESLLTIFHKDRIEERAITIIISGSRDRATMAKEETRFAALDGRLQDLDATPPPSPSLVPWVSAPWSDHFKWQGKGEIAPEELAHLKQLAQKAHAQKRLLRFWEIPDQPNAWKTLRNAGVDLINTDDLAGLAKFFNDAKQPK